MIFQKLAKIEPKISINPLTIVFSLPSSSSKSAEIVPMVSTKQSTVEEEIEKDFAGLADAERLCIFELYHEFERIIQIVEARAKED
jgi:hypothetical protein